MTTDLYVNNEIPKRPYTESPAFVAGDVMVATGTGIELEGVSQESLLGDYATTEALENAVDTLNETIDETVEDFNTALAGKEPTLPNVVTAGTYGSSTKVAQITLNAKGIATTVTEIDIVTGLEVLKVASGTLTPTAGSKLILASGSFNLDCSNLVAGDCLEIVQVAQIISSIVVTYITTSPITGYRDESLNSLASNTLYKGSRVLLSRVGTLIYSRRTHTIFNTDFAIQPAIDSPYRFTFNLSNMAATRSIIMANQTVDLRNCSFTGANDSNTLSGTRCRIVGGSGNTVSGTDNVCVGSDVGTVSGTGNFVVGSQTPIASGSYGLILGCAKGDGVLLPAYNQIDTGTVRSALISCYGSNIAASLSHAVQIGTTGTTVNVGSIMVLEGRVSTTMLTNSLVEGGNPTTTSVSVHKYRLVAVLDGTLRTLTANGSATESSVTLPQSCSANTFSANVNIGNAAMHRIRLMGGNGSGAPFRQVLAERLVWVRRRSVGNNCEIVKTETPTADINLDGITFDLQIDLVGTNSTLLRIRAADTSGTHGTAGQIVAHVESHYMGI